MHYHYFNALCGLILECFFYSIDYQNQTFVTFFLSQKK